jgi:hypothetical protein
MPFKSKAQRRLFYAKMNRGEISKKTIDEWEKDTPKNIPERKKEASMDEDIKGLRKAFLEEDGGAWIAGEDLHKEAAANVEVGGSAPSSAELMLIRDPKERERYRADMAARNELRAMKRPLSPKETVTRQTTKAASYMMAKLKSKK